MNEPTPRPPRPDSWTRHLGRYLGASFAVGLAILVLMGFIWTARILSRTGYRRRDLLLVCIPIVGTIAGVRSMWRYTARDVYWTPREDRPSSVLPERQRRAVVWGGWVAYPLLFVAPTAAFLLAGPDAAGWSENDRTALRDALESEGVPPDVAACVADHVAADVPEGPPTDDDDPRLDAAFEDAFADCG